MSFRDLARYFYPLRFFTATSIKSGIIPLWNPYIFCGTPHIALQQSVVFYPLSIIYYIFPFDMAFNIFLLVHVAFAGLFTFFLCRRWGFGEPASLVSAVIFMFSGYVVSILNLATTLSSVIWLPLVLLFFDKALTSGNLKDIFLSAIFLGIMFLGGEPSIFYSTLWVMLFYALFFWSSDRRSLDLKKVMIWSAVTIGAGALLSSIQLMPFLELMRLADRTVSFARYEDLTKWSLSLKDTLSFFIPFLARTDFSRGSYWKEQNWVILIYIGVFAMLLAAIAIFLKKDWRTRFLCFIGTLFLFVSYGNNTPFYHLIYKFIPGFKYIRYPVRFLYVTTFAIAILCGAGFGAYSQARRAGSERLNKFFKIVLFILYASSIVFLALHIYRNGLIEAARNFCVKYLDPKKEGGVLFSLVAAIVNAERFLGFFTGGGLILFLGLRLKMRQGTINFAFISLIIADLFTAMPGRQIMLNENILHATTPNIEYLKKDRSLFRFFVSPKTREADIFLEGSTYEEAIYASKDMLSANWPVIYGLYDASGYDSIRLARYSKLMMLVETSGSPSYTKILDILNAKYLVILNKMDSRDYKLVNRGKAYLYENMNVLPRAFLVGSFKVLKDETEIANRFKSKEFDPSKEVILEEEPVLAHSSKLITHNLNERAEIIKYSPNEVIIKATLNSIKFLVLSDTYYPGWKVYVDGRRDKIYVADYMLRAVYLTPGGHIVRFVFDSFSFKVGLCLTVTTLIGILFVLLAKKNNDIILFKRAGISV